MDRQEREPRSCQKAPRHHASVKLDPARTERMRHESPEEVIAHLIALVGADVSVTLEIQAEVRSGFPDKVVRTVTENGRTPKFSQKGFEKD
jgi:hypothetical protein